MINSERIQAAVFDLDDTLCAYWEASKKALRQTFAELAPEELKPEELYDSWADTFRMFSKKLKTTPWYARYLKEGEPTRTEQMRQALERLGIVDPLLANKLSKRYHDLRDEFLALFPESLAALDKVGERYPLGMITNGPADIQREEIARCGIGNRFRSILIEGEMGFGKPDQRVFRLAEKELGSPPEGILMIGNSYSSDIRPAIEAGWQTIWIQRPTDLPPSAAHELPEEKPDLGPEPDQKIGDLLEILPLLNLL